MDRYMERSWSAVVKRLKDEKIGGYQDINQDIYTELYYYYIDL